jgi:hypothetical protein
MQENDRHREREGEEEKARQSFVITSMPYSLFWKTYTIETGQQ